MPEPDSLWDPAVFLPLPGTGDKLATTRSTLRPCPCCGTAVFEVVSERRVDKKTGEATESVSCLCPTCCKPKPGERRRVLGWVDMVTGEATEAGGCD